MPSILEYGEYTFDEIRDFGDNTDRVNDIMMVPTLGQTSVLRYGVNTGYRDKINCIAVTASADQLVLSGAYAAAQAGARIQVRFGGTVKFETQFNWTGLSGYIGGSDDYGSEGEILIETHDSQVDASTVIDVYVTPNTNVRKAFYISLSGTLDDGTVVREEKKAFIDGTSAQSISLYTVPAGRYLELSYITISDRHIDLFFGKGYLVYNGLPVMIFNLFQTELGGMNGLVIPLWEAPLNEGSSIGFRVDSFACGGEIVAAALYGVSTAIPTGGGGGGSRRRLLPVVLPT